MMKLNFKACIFDLDGVITKTALVHAAAWKNMFDTFLKKYSQKQGLAFVEFTIEDDYRLYVDGKPRYEGVKSFLESRNIDLPYGKKTDGDQDESICGLGNRKNTVFMDVLKNDGVKVYTSTVDLIIALKEQGIRIGVASSSRNCQHVLQSANLEHLFETRVDGVISEQLQLRGKPCGDIFVRAAENLNVTPADSIVIEDAVSGVQAGVDGAFGLVVGLARENNANQLKKHGADVVIPDFAGVTIEKLNEWFNTK